MAAEVRQALALAALVVPAAALASGVLTGWVRRYAERALLDAPNARSSHTNPTPRGGGLAIVIVVLAGIAALAAAGVLDARLAAGIGGGGALVAGIGWLDDHGHVAARWRALAQAAAAAWALAWIGAPAALRTGIGELPLGPLGFVLSLLGIVWLTNLYNFMDGIDGIAGGEGVAAGVVGGILLLLAGAPGLALLALLAGAACAGFLVWNWAPARIFMGDVGSGFLGFVFGAAAVASERAGAVPLLAWVVLLGVFVFDATVTLVRRVTRGERWYDAHRSHAYQRAVQAGHSHARVSGTAAVLNLVLGGLAALACLRPTLLLPVLVTAIVLLALVYRRIERLRPFPPSPVAGP